jgi:chlorite dismutase
MSYVLVSYAVKDYARWRAVFDADTIVQRRAGVFVRHVLHEEKNHHRVTLLAQVRNRSDAMALSRRKDLDKLIEKAGLLRETVKCTWLGEK